MHLYNRKALSTQPNSLHAIQQTAVILLSILNGLLPIEPLINAYWPPGRAWRSVAEGTGSTFVRLPNIQCHRIEFVSDAAGDPTIVARQLPHCSFHCNLPARYIDKIQFHTTDSSIRPSHTKRAITLRAPTTPPPGPRGQHSHCRRRSHARNALL